MNTCIKDIGNNDHKLYSGIGFLTHIKEGVVLLFCFQKGKRKISVNLGNKNKKHFCFTYSKCL